MNTTSLPIILSIRPGILESFIECERGADADEMTGPSPLTTMTILRRDPKRKSIILNTLEEAAQVLDCCRYGTFPLHHSRTAKRLFNLLDAYVDVKTIRNKHDKGEWAELAGLVKEAQAQLAQD